MGVFHPLSRKARPCEMERLGDAALRNVFEYLAFSHADVARACATGRKLRTAHVGAASFLWGATLPRCCGVTLATVRRRLCGCVEQLLPPCGWVEGLASSSAGESTPRPVTLASCPVLVAGSYALHALLSSQGTSGGGEVSAAVLARLPHWQPNDIDVWLVNRWNPVAVARWMARRIEATLRLSVTVCDPGRNSHAYAGVRDAPPEEEDDDVAPWATYLRAMDGSSLSARAGRCGVTLVRDLYVRGPGGERVLKVSLIGTRPAPPQARTCLQTLHASTTFVPPLEPEEVLERFDFDVCQVGYLRRDNPEHEPPQFLYANQSGFWDALRLGRARSTVHGRGPLGRRELERRRKYAERGFLFADA